MTAKCIYCRKPLDAMDNDASCWAAYDCRDRMRDREKRIVRVFWRVYFEVPESRRWDCGCNKSFCVSCCPGIQCYGARKRAMSWGVGWAQTNGIPTRLVRVTVRRKGKQ